MYIYIIYIILYIILYCILYITLYLSPLATAWLVAWDFQDAVTNLSQPELVDFEKTGHDHRVCGWSRHVKCCDVEMGRCRSSLEGSITVQGHKLSGDDIQLSRKLKDGHGYSVSADRRWVKTLVMPVLQKYLNIQSTQKIRKIQTEEVFSDWAI